MVPDFDKVVSHQIRKVEQRPVPWNKEAVWRNVQMETGMPRSKYYFHAAAAAVVLLFLYLGIAQIPKESKHDSRKVAANPIDRPGKPATTLIPETNLESTPGTAKNDGGKIAPVPTAEIAKTEVHFPVAQPMKPKTPGVDTAKTEISIEKEEAQSPGNVAVSGQKIRPVVGVIAEPRSEINAYVKQKKRLRKLKSSDPVPWEDPGNALVFTVRN